MPANRSAAAQAFSVASAPARSGSAFKGRTRLLSAVPANSPPVDIWERMKGQGKECIHGLA
jgi:hypothetical protein